MPGKAARPPWSGRAGAARRAGADRGVSAIELAILAPALLLIVWMTIQYALYYQGRQVALAAARIGVRVASQDEHTVPNWRIISQDAAKNYYAGLGTKVLGAGIRARAEVSGPGQVRVTVTGHVASILLGLKLPINETAGAPIECFRPDANGGLNC
ncbi:MAG TPA: TadE/TadG family type IV pilus assembly protein [Streptosporangiaceae bacterium]|jgi:Flp pilus assembly protein TadG